MGKSEGEFKKFIETKRSEYAGLDETNHYVAGKLDVLITIEQWIENAEKEFPKSDSIIERCSIPIPLECLEFAEERQKILTWFVKWFGK